MNETWYRLNNINSYANLAYWIYCNQSLRLTHGGQVMHLCVNKLAIIGSDNALSPGWRQAISSTNVGILLIQTFGTNFMKS